MLNAFGFAKIKQGIISEIKDSRGECMAMSYKKLWKLLIDKNLNKSDLRERTGLSTTTIAKLGRDEYVSMEIVSKICATLHCDVGDMMEYVPDKSHNKFAVDAQ